MLADVEQQLDLEDSGPLTSRKRLALAFKTARQTTKVIPPHEQPLADSERLLDSDHLDTLASRSNLTMPFRAARQTAKAIPMLERTLADSERIVAARHPSAEVVREKLDALRGKPKRRGVGSRTSPVLPHCYGTSHQAAHPAVPPSSNKRETWQRVSSA
jgi:hypothetical protein